MWWPPASWSHVSVTAKGLSSDRLAGQRDDDEPAACAAAAAAMFAAARLEDCCRVAAGGGAGGRARSARVAAFLGALAAAGADDVSTTLRVGMSKQQR